MSREVANFRTFWKATTFSSVLEPTSTCSRSASGSGRRSSTRSTASHYVEFVGTGMVATAVIFSSALPAMFGTFVKHRFQHTYDAILAAPVDVEELVTAEMLWIGVRAGFYGCFPLLVSFFFGLEPTWAMLLVPFFAFITALGFAAFGIAVAGTVGKIDQFNYVTTLVITPLFLVAGTFFPIDQLPEGFQVLAQVQPALPAGRAGPRGGLRVRGGGRPAGGGARGVRVRDVAAGGAPDGPPAGRLGGAHRARTDQRCRAAQGSVLPAASVARTRKDWLPGAHRESLRRAARIPGVAEAAALEGRPGLRGLEPEARRRPAAWRVVSPGPPGRG